MSYSLSISALSLTYSGGLIAGGPGRILGKFWRREASGTGSGRLQANVHPRKHTLTHSYSVPRTCSGFLTLLLHFLTDSLVHFVQNLSSFRFCLNLNQLAAFSLVCKVLEQHVESFVYALS